MKRVIAVAIAAAATALAAPSSSLAAGIDLSSYQRIGRYDLPEPTRTAAPAGNLLAQEASGVAYDWDTDTLFVVGDGGTSVTQVSKTGQLIDTMTLPAGSSPQGTEFYDTEGIAYVGGGKFVFTEERYRQLVQFTYVGGGTLTRAAAKTVKLGKTTGNNGLEGLTYDPQTSGFIVVKENGPLGIFQTGIDFDAGTATNGSPTTENSVNLFDPALAGVADFSDVFSLANLPAAVSGADATHLLIISQESGKIIEVDRAGQVSGTLTIPNDAGNPLSVPDQTHEGVTMDNQGRIYSVSEEGGGDGNHPQLWVYAPVAGPNAAPTAVTLTNQVSSLPQGTSTANRVKVADVSVSDDGQGTNTLAVTGPDASSFEVDAGGLYLKAGTTLSKSSYSVAVTVDDTTIGATPDATSSTFTLSITAPASLIISEVSPWSSGNTSYAADWWEVTNTGSAPVDLTGYKMDDSSNAIGSAVALNGVGVLAPGKSAILLEGSATTVAAFKTAWFGDAVPAGLQVGFYSGSGVGLSTDGDGVNLFDAAGSRVTGVSFGASTTGFTFDNPTGLATVTALSAAGRNGAFTLGTQTGSPGTIAPSVAVTEVSPWSSGNSPYRADWFELTNTGAHAVDITGWKMDDSSNAIGSAVALNGVTSLAPGESAIFSEGDVAAAFETAWFGANVPAGFQMGNYSGSGVGLSTDGDAVHVFDAIGRHMAGVSFGVSTSGRSFDNSAGAATVTALSSAGVNGAYTSGAGEIGSPGRIASPHAEVSTPGDLEGSVPNQLSLVLGPKASFGVFVAGVAQDYLAEMTATITSTAGDAALSVADTGTTAPGHLVNGAFALPQAFQARAGAAAYAPVSGTPATLLTYGAPVSNDQVAIGFKQPIGAGDGLRAGSYAKTVTFTLSTTTP